MKLTLEKIIVENMIFGSPSGINNGVITIDDEALREMILKDQRIAKVHIRIARPEESIRIYSVRDVIEPRVKIDGPGQLFPGIIGQQSTVGQGITKILEGAAVVTVGHLQGTQDGIIDMSGPGAAYSPFSKTHNLLISCEPVPGLRNESFDEALRLAGLKTAHYIGEACQQESPQVKTTYETLPIEEQKQQYPNLPNVGYVYMLQGQGLFYDTYFYGKPARDMLPTYLYPTEVMEGAIVNGNLMIACDRNTTYHHLNNPVIEDLYAAHGKEINFCGVIVTNQPTTLKGKENASDLTAALAEELGLDGVIISKEEYGNTDADLMMNCRKLEEKGIKTVLITDEFAGQDGTSQSLADADPKADAIVSTGNANEAVLLPQMERIIGNSAITETPECTTQQQIQNAPQIKMEIFSFVGSTNEFGFNKMSTKGY
ncbi:glycine reductase [Tindallia magadiensis]|uniref:Glycine reductase n=1 Tax=Tindallia magadiensis TaxID=69895 RepID=A0A1I3BYN7_9FIRM|nr:glycine/sarcosine/betaine reductase component B subunit [Tindallia magadiensis]SFH67300.1 glycine reductase [Tindallia magadiensis]